MLLHVPFQMVRSSKSSGANGASHDLLQTTTNVFYSGHLNQHAVLPREELRFCGMQSQMPIQVIGPAKALPANWAQFCKRFLLFRYRSTFFPSFFHFYVWNHRFRHRRFQLPCMSLHVLPQIVLSVELSIAKVTFVLHNRTVAEHVTIDMRLPGESHATYSAAERPIRIILIVMIYYISVRIQKNRFSCDKDTAVST